VGDDQLQEGVCCDIGHILLIYLGAGIIIYKFTNI
jgi:hypothetical protein